MKHPKTRKANRDNKALDKFLTLTKADALLFYVAEILHEMGLKDVVTPVQDARAEVARRLEACQGRAYVQMKLKGKQPASRPSRRGRVAAKPKKRRTAA